MQITDELNSEQRLLDRDFAESFKKNFPIYSEMEEAGFSVEFFETKSFGGLTVVPSTKRVRVKINLRGLDDIAYPAVISDKIEDSFHSRLENPVFLRGGKQSTRFRKPRTWGKK